MRNEVNPHAVAGTDKRREDAYHLIDSGERAHLPMELSIQRRGVLIGNGARVEYKTVAPEKGAERQIGVVEQRIGRDGRGQLAPHGINTPRARLYRVDAGVVQPDPFDTGGHGVYLCHAACIEWMRVWFSRIHFS